MEKQFYATPLQSTLVIAMFYVAQIWAAPWLGKLSDRFGRQPILIISQAGTIVAYLMSFFASQLGAGLERLGLTLGLSGGRVSRLGVTSRINASQRIDLLTSSAAPICVRGRKGSV